MTGHKINTAKTMVMRWNSSTSGTVQVEWRRKLLEVLKSVYLGGTVTHGQKGGSGEDISCRFGKARSAFNQLRNIWKSSRLKLNTKMKIFKSNAIAVVLYWVRNMAHGQGRRDQA